jgi:hypothetical protein
VEVPGMSPAHPWTVFSLPAKPGKPLPDLTALGRFLARCLCFTSHLASVAVRVDGRHAYTVTKSVFLAKHGPVPLPSALALPAGLARAQGMFHLNEARLSRVDIRVGSSRSSIDFVHQNPIGHERRQHPPTRPCGSNLYSLTG